MNSGMQVTGGRLRQGDGDYGILVLPNLTGIDLESLEQIQAFVTGGGTLIATRRLPDRAWGWKDRDARTARVRELTELLFGTGAARQYGERKVGQGRVIFCPDEQGSFRKALFTAQPDIRFHIASPHVSFVHRREPERDFYFLANTSEEGQELEGIFRVGHKAPELWTLQTGATEPLVVFEHLPEGTRVPFTLGPLESKVIVFSAARRPPAATRTDLPLEAGGARVFSNGSYFHIHSGVRKSVAVTGIPAAWHLTARWRLALGDQRYEFEELPSWTELAKSRYFSGTGIYEAEFDAPEFKDFGVELDLGAVRETADVHLNGAPAGVLWMRPYRCDITRLLRPGRNRLRVAVTNLLINRILGDGPIDYSDVYAKYGRRFPAGDEWEFVREPYPSGLLGPVHLRILHELVYRVHTVQACVTSRSAYSRRRAAMGSMVAAWRAGRAAAASATDPNSTATAIEVAKPIPRPAPINGRACHRTSISTSRRPAPSPTFALGGHFLSARQKIPFAFNVGTAKIGENRLGEDLASFLRCPSLACCC
jgi:hypothetical protein